jgi:two-component system chemotaxis response regulator CheY
MCDSSCTPRGIKVLVVDDSPTVRSQARQALGAEGYEVLEANDGLAGFETIESTPDLRVIICDVNMPRMNGLELLSKLREADCAVPVVMLTTEGQPALIQQARSEGAKGWLVKPFKPEMLCKAVGKLAHG